jgi:hypothetical protein
MADYPCDEHKARYPGASHRVYVNAFRGEEKIQLKGTVCGDCLDQLLTDWLPWALHQTPDGWTIPPDDEAIPLETLWMASTSDIRPLRGSTRW